MKKVLFIAIAFCSITTISVKVIAQEKIQYQRQKSFTDSLEVIYTRSNIPKGKEFALTITTDKNKEKGNIVKFTASGGRIVRVAVGTGDKQLECTNSTTNYGEGTTTGIFYIDSPAYDKKYNIYTFYAEGFPEYVWSAIVERIQVATIHQIPNKNLLKKIPN